MSDNPLIADSRPEGDAGVVSMDNLAFRGVSGQDGWEGAGQISGFASALQNMERGDLLGMGVDVGGVVFDALGLIENPMRVCLAAGIGWLIEHLGILNEILSVMAGDPNQVADHAQTWTNIGDKVNKRVLELQSLVDKLPAQSGAIDGYRIAVNDFAKVVALSGEAAYRAADGTNTAATVVATTRSVIRDWIADWASGRVLAWLGFGPLTPVTFGGAQAVFIADSVVSGARLAARATKELRKLVKHLDELADGAKAGSRSLTDAAAALRKAGRTAPTPSSATKAARAAGSKAPRIPGEGELVDRMQDLGATASKHADGANDAVTASAKAAANRAKTGQKIGSRNAPPKERVTEAAHASAKRAQKSADTRVAAHTKKLSDVADEARDLASDIGRVKQRLADEATAAAEKAARPSLGERVAGVAAQTAKEAIVQTSNEDLRAENARNSYLDQAAEHYPGEQASTVGPTPETPTAGNDETRTGPPVPGGAGQPPPTPDTAPPSAEQAPDKEQTSPAPDEPTVTTTGPAPQPVRQESWQVRGTLDP